MIAFDQGMNIISQMIVFWHWSYETNLKYEIAFTFLMSEDFLLLVLAAVAIKLCV